MLRLNEIKNEEVENQDSTVENNKEEIKGYYITKDMLKDIFFEFGNSLAGDGTKENHGIHINGIKLIKYNDSSKIIFDDNIQPDDINRLIGSDDKTLESFCRNYFNFVFDELVLKMYNSQEYLSIPTYSFSQLNNTVKFTI